MNRLKKSGVLLAAIITLLVAASPWSTALATQSEAVAAISSAQTAMLSGYNAALEAEAAGANITSLQVKLNAAGESLSHAELAYASGNFDSAISLANQCTGYLNNFSSDAKAQQISAGQQANQVFYINVVGSTFGALAVVVAGFLVWRQIAKAAKPRGVIAGGSSKS